MKFCSKTQIKLQNSIPKHISRHEPGLFNLLPLLLQAGPRFLEPRAVTSKGQPQIFETFWGLTRYTIHPIHPIHPHKNPGNLHTSRSCRICRAEFCTSNSSLCHGKSKEGAVWRRQDAICRLKKKTMQPMPANSSTYPALNLQDFRVASASWI